MRTEKWRFTRAPKSKYQNVRRGLASNSLLENEGTIVPERIPESAEEEVNFSTSMLPKAVRGVCLGETSVVVLTFAA